MHLLFFCQPISRF